MAKINEEVLVIKITTLFADDDEVIDLMNEGNITDLKRVIGDIAESRTIVEIEKA